MHHVLLDMLEANALSLKDIKFVSMTSQDAAAAIISNTVDAALLAQIQYAKLVTDGTGKALLAGSSNPKWKGSHAVLVRSAYLKDNAPAAVALVKALVIANDYAKKNREKSIEILAKSGAPIKAIEFLQPGVVDFHVKAGNEVVAAFEGVASFLLDNHLVTRKTDIKAWIDSQYYEAAVK
jgi:ABC-type nitrate/sulfonate/bicarbonate transport system substrate-binding protein